MTLTWDSPINNHSHCGTGGTTSGDEWVKDKDALDSRMARQFRVICIEI